MNITSMLNRNLRERTIGKSNVLFYVLVAVIVVCGMTSVVYAQIYYPILKLDIGRGHNAAEIQDDFIAFTLNDSGTVVDGIKVEIEPVLTGEAIQVRWRWGPTGIPYEQLYRDFIFTVNGGIRITLSELDPNETYGITLYSWDQASAQDHVADWFANEDFCLTTSFTGGTDVVAEDSYAFSGNATADDTGKIILEAISSPLTSNPNQYFCFLNAVVVSTLTPFNIARRPVPEDGAIITTNEVELQWTPGYTSVSANIYVGESFDDVNEATTENTDIFRGNTVGVSFPIGSAGNPYPDGLSEETTYYWRIDEVEEDGTENKGDIWSFTVAPKTAFMPNPIDGSLFADPNITLGWTPGAGAIEHRVFFGDKLEDVQAGIGGTDKGTVTDPNYTPGTLERDKIYYWRIDESDGTNTYTGNVWSFTTSRPGMGTVTMDFWENVAGDHTLVNLLDDPRYPDSPTRSEALTEFGTVDGVGDGYGAQISGWLYCPVTGEYKFWLSSGGQGELWLSTDDEPANIVLLASEANWGTYNSFTIKSIPISLVAGEKYYIMARWKDFGSWDHCQVAWKGPGIPEQEVIQGNYLSPFEPVIAFGPNPGNGSVDVSIDSALSWTPGKFAATQDVYLDTDVNDVNNVDKTNLASYPNVMFANVADSNYVPGLLDFNTTYHWRVDTVNDVHPDSPWKGKVWSFTTGNYIVLEDFESYTNFPLNEIWNTWSDGYVEPPAIPTNGGIIGYPNPSDPDWENYVETEIVYSGNQSAPLLYDNSVASYSEVTLSTDNLTIGQDWTINGVNVLRLWFYGDPNNAATEQLYVKLNNSKILINEIDLTDASWQNVDINLSDFGINLASVTQIAIGLERTGATGGSGMLLMEDIRLYWLEP